MIATIKACKPDPYARELVRGPWRLPDVVTVMIVGRTW
jgi:hypothetical protein